MRKVSSRFMEMISKRGILVELSNPQSPVEEEKLYDYDAKTGRLAINRERFYSGALEKILSLIKKSPRGISVQLYLVEGSHKILERVRKISYLPDSHVYQS